MPLHLSELLVHLPDRERASYLRLEPENQRDLRDFILESERLPRSSDDLLCAPGTVSGPAVERARVCERGRVELLPLAGAIALGILLLVLPQQGRAHGGGLNSDGCHNETATGGYHCHNTPGTGGSSSNNDDEEDVDWGVVGAVAGGALALWLILDLMNDDEDQTLSGFSFTPRVGPSATGFVVEYALDGLNRLGFGVQTDPVRDNGTYSGFHWRLAF